MHQMSNEQLCHLAKQGNPEAQNLLIGKNLPYVKETAYELWNTQKELNQSLGILPDDLIQEGSLGLYHCIGNYDPDSGNKFLTYASSQSTMPCWIISEDKILLLNPDI